MDHPVKDIPGVIKSLTEGSPLEQRTALYTYFVEDAAFVHPLCRIGRFKNYRVPLINVVINSRWVIWMIYRWYKILSPTIALDVHSVVYDQKHQLLYVTISQLFSLWFVPFYDSHVKLVTVLHLQHSAADSKYYIESQEDLYQSNEVVKFFWPGGNTILRAIGFLATFVCVIGALALAPFTWVEQRVAGTKRGKLT